MAKATTKKPSSEEVETRRVWVSVERLFLDSENPRLASSQGGNAQEELVKILWDQMAVDEVAFSIAANGYFLQEPLFVIPKKKGKKDPGEDDFIVVEGNRRLAAVVLLRNSELRRKIRATDLPEINKKQREELDQLPVLIYESREDLWEILGFRHINGPQRWDSFSKAQYVETVFENYGVSLKDIAYKIGDRHATVTRIYRGLKILRQAEENTGFDRDDRVKGRFAFSHLYTAVSDKTFQDFLGIKPDDSLRPNPVPKSRLDRLSELMTWLYGKKSQEIEPVVRTQNPDLWRLQSVISRPASLSALRTNLSLERAYEISLGDDRRFRDSLTRATEEIKQAKATVTKGYQGEDDLWSMVEDVLVYTDSLKKEMESIRKDTISSKTRK